MPQSMLSTSSVQSAVSLPPFLPSAGVPLFDPVSPPPLSPPPQAATPRVRARRTPRMMVHWKDRRMKRPFMSVWLELPDSERRARGHVDRVLLGLSASCSPSPTRLKASTVSSSAMPGKNMNHQATSKIETASDSMAPHDGRGGWTPTPRNESAASSRMFAGMNSDV